MTGSNIKLCINCKHCNENLSKGVKSQCLSPKNIKNFCSKYTGFGNDYRWFSLEILRGDGFISSLISKTCGKRGRWFEEGK